MCGQNNTFVCRTVHPINDIKKNVEHSSNISMKKNVTKRVNFDDTPLVISRDRMSNEEQKNYWYNRSDLNKFRTMVFDEALFTRLNSPRDKNLLKAYKATTKGNTKHAVTFLESWCSPPSDEYSCNRGLEPMFNAGALEDLENDRQTSIKEVLRMQNELHLEGSRPTDYEIRIKEVYEKASKNSKNFYLAMGLADSIEVNSKGAALELKKRSLAKRIYKTFRTSVSRQA